MYLVGAGGDPFELSLLRRAHVFATSCACGREGGEGETHGDTYARRENVLDVRARGKCTRRSRNRTLALCEDFVIKREPSISVGCLYVCVRVRVDVESSDSQRRLLLMYLARLFVRYT